MLVVTRHPALVEYLVEEGIVPFGTKVLTHVSPAELAGEHVVGVLPLHLAALCDKVTVVPLSLPAILRGVELSVEQVREFASSPTTYKVTEV